MAEIYSREITITMNMLDYQDYVKPSAFLDAVQFVGSEHSDAMKCGFSDLISQDVIWVVIKNEINIYKKVKTPSSLRFVTYPLKPRIFEYPRDTEVYQGDELIALIRATWMMYSLKENKIVTLPVYSNTELKEPIVSGRIQRIEKISKEEMNFEKEVEVTYHQIDHNKHLNNTHYLDFFSDIFEDKYNFKRINVEYIKQAYIHQKISLFSAKINNFAYVFGYIGDEQIFAVKGEIQDEDQ